MDKAVPVAREPLHKFTKGGLFYYFVLTLITYLMYRTKYRYCCPGPAGGNRCRKNYIDAKAGGAPCDGTDAGCPTGQTCYAGPF